MRSYKYLENIEEHLMTALEYLKEKQAWRKFSLLS